MYLSFGVEYFGDCSSALDFYESVFENVSVERRPYRDMDNDFQSEIFNRLMDGGKINRQLGEKQQMTF